MITLPDNLRPQEGQTNGGDSSPPEPLLLMAAAEMHNEGRFEQPSPAMGAIERAAERHGMDPAVLKGIAGIESSMDPGSNRYRSTQYKGLFQIGREEWAQYGRGGNIYDAGQNADAAARMLKDHSAWFEHRYGREPAPGELYMMHQQGRGFYSHGTMTNIAGNPYPGMRGPQTPASFEAGWSARLGREIARYGGTAPAISMTHEVPTPEVRERSIDREFSPRIPRAPVRASGTLRGITDRFSASEDVSSDPDVGGKILRSLGQVLTRSAPRPGRAKPDEVVVHDDDIQDLIRHLSGVLKK